jgi:serine/threonine-protein kinase
MSETRKSANGRHMAEEKSTSPPPAQVCPMCGAPTELATEDLLGALTTVDGEMPPPPTPLPAAVAQLAAGLLVAPERAGPAGLPLVAGYEILGPLGRGGMGLVYQARDLKSGRVVALKMIRGGAHAEPRDLARFRTEAEAVAQLQHPHIVQIYEVGEQDGWAYFALEFVPGGSLARQLAGRPQPAGLSAKLVETLAQAMDYAHQRGIIHRDLKPANILMNSPQRHKEHKEDRDKDEEERLSDDAQASSLTSPSSLCSLWLCGEFTPKISDFGLAKRLEPEPATSAHRDWTQTGEVLGTPSYMAPEQTWGRPGDVGPAADVYALGAILYECLTGRPPFQAATSLDTLLQVRSEEPVPPRRLVPSVPRDLETICLKCLRKEPRRRYQSAAALAEDLRRFQAGEPVQARPAAAWERALRWARRRKTVAALVGLCGLAILSLVALGLWHVGQLQGYNAQLEVYIGELSAERNNANRLRDRAQAKEAEARHQQLEADKQWRRAEANFQSAQAAVELMLTRVSEDPERLALEPRMELVRRQLLEDALRFYQNLLKERAADPEVRSETASAYLRVGDIQKVLGHRAAAEKAYGAALDLFRRLAAEFPQRSAYRYHLAGCYSNLATLQLDSQRTEEAERGFRRALELQTALVKECPDSLDYRIALAGSHHNLGTLLVGARRLKEGEEMLRGALDFRRQLAEANRANPEYRQALARTQFNLGLAAHLAGRREEAAQAYGQALDWQRRLVKDFPRVPAYRHELARSHQNLAIALAQTNQLQEAEAEYGRAMDLLRQLAEDFPRVPAYRDELARNHHNLAALWERRNRPRDAEQAYGYAIDLQQGLVKEFPKVVVYRSELGKTFGHLAELLFQQGRLADARRNGEQAVEHQLAALKLRPGQAAYGRALAHNYRVLAKTLVRLGDHAAAAQAAVEIPRHIPPAEGIYRLAAALVASCVPLAEKDPALPAEKREALAKAYGDQAVALLRQALLQGLSLHADQLKGDPNLAALRSLADFQKLIQELQQAAQPGAK